MSDNVGVYVVILSYFNGTTWRNLTMSYDSETGLWTITILRVPAGELRFKVYAEDYSVNWAVSEEYVCVVSRRVSAVLTWVYILATVAITLIVAIALLVRYRKKRP